MDERRVLLSPPEAKRHDDHFSVRHDGRFSVRHGVAAAALVFLSIVGSSQLTRRVATVGESGTFAVADMEETGSIGSLSFHARREGYDPLPAATLDLYARWSHVLEPGCRMILSVTDPMSSHEYAWEVVSNRTGVTVFHGAGAEVSLNFTGVNDYYSIRLAERRRVGGPTTRTARTNTAVTKYVRREIRALSDDDRERYFAAMGVVYSLPLEEGRALYGKRFVNHGHLTSLHDSYLYAYHENLAFGTAHPGFQLKLERAVLAVDAGAGLPYWDFTIDHDLGAAWGDSPVYRKDWFGTVNNGEGDDFRIRGNFRNVTTVLDPNGTEYPRAYHTIRGFLGPSMRYVNPSRYLQRTDEFCGFRTVEGPASCGHMMRCFDNYTTLYAWDRCIEDHIHGNIHNLHTGMWRCPVSWRAFADEHASWLDPHLLSLLAVHAPFLIQSVSADLVQCPAHCGRRRGFSECRCSPTDASNVSAVGDVDALSCEAVYGWVGEHYEKLYETGYLGTHFLELKGGRYLFRGLSSARTCALNRLLVKTVAFPGEFGVMGGSPSSNDPLFFVMHQIFEKMSTALRLSPRYAGLNTTWDNVGIGNYTGLGWNSETPFEAALFEPGLGGEIDDGAFLTNKQLWALLKPDGDTVPYIYDQFRQWGSCTVNFNS